MNFNSCSQSDFKSALINFSNDYYHSANSSVSDEQFDELTILYQQRFNTEWNYLGNTDLQTSDLPIFMGSLDKCKSESQLNIFFKRFVKTNNKNTVVYSDKIDGISLLYVLKKGRLFLYTRGNGFKGTDVSYLQKYVSFPILQNDCIIRGELVILRNTFLEKYSDEYDNPRAMVSGLIHSKDNDANKLRDLSFFAYSIHNWDDTVTTMFNQLQTYGFQTPNFKQLPSTFINEGSVQIPLIHEFLTEYITLYKSKRPYEMDGIVVTDDTIHIEKYGENPKHTIAFKILGQAFETKVIQVEWNLTKHNILKPRVLFHPTEIDGSTIEYASGFNAKYIYDNSIGKNSIIQITKSGDVIPHILKVVSPTTPELPTDFKWCDNGIDIQPHESTSTELFIKRLICMFETCGIKGIKDGIIRNITNHGITNEYDFFHLSKPILLRMDKIKDKQAENIIQGIQQLLNNLTLQQLMIGSCLFPSFGPKRINDAVTAFPQISEYILNDSPLPDNLEQQLHTIGFKTIAQTFISCLYTFKQYYQTNSFFHTYIIRLCIDDKPKNNDKPNKQITLSSESSSKLSNLVIKDKGFCFSGFRDEQIKLYIEQQGGIVHDSITKKVNYLLLKGDAITKAEKAQKYGISIIQF
jgi:NAD-dependent DNA ligase